MKYFTANWIYSSTLLLANTRDLVRVTSSTHFGSCGKLSSSVSSFFYYLFYIFFVIDMSNNSENNDVRGSKRERERKKNSFNKTSKKDQERMKGNCEKVLFLLLLVILSSISQNDRLLFWHFKGKTRVALALSNKITTKE